MSRGLVILDRDGVINRDSPDFVRSLAEWQPLPGSLDAIARLKRAGLAVAVATNQSGIGRGLLGADDLAAMHAELARLLAARDCSLDAVVHCPHAPGAGCGCRKPRPGLYRRVADLLGLPLRGAFVVGDSLRDLQAAAAVQASPWLVLTGKGERTRASGGLPAGTRVCADLAAAADAIIAASRGESSQSSGRAGSEASMAEVEWPSR